MIKLYLTLKVIHVLGASVLFGAGLGIAFFTWMAHRTGDAATIAATGRMATAAGSVFIATAIVVQPVSGTLLALGVGYSLRAPWIEAALALYVLAALCWLAILRTQIALRDLARAAAQAHAALPPRYFELFRIWCVLSWLAFVDIIGIFSLMISKPAMW